MKPQKQLDCIKVYFAYDYPGGMWRCLVKIPEISVSHAPMMKMWGLHEEKDTIEFNTKTYKSMGWNIFLSSEYLSQNGPMAFLESLDSLDEELHEYFSNNEIRAAVEQAIRQELDKQEGSLLLQTIATAPPKYYLSKEDIDAIVSSSNAKVEHGSQLKNVLPGLQALVKHPETGWTESVEACIISLNDTYAWPREKVADWLDTLDVDLSFPTEDSNERDSIQADEHDSKN